ncbi:hypothetical protein GYMLUDRAFT_76850 [Collybiopsis luxurians FD-317 M1]|uniref:MYND-type domain-containing protein n=1 Tax=Collybiopsis luxurians FD-317 M1 TaxID=944289 RepID=A0A0D0AW80_9AGAR|nr:hypothetical protein GYMLUDRAFT_76850 [Collybiopsis luxurians FD-317 M1]
MSQSRYLYSKTRRLAWEGSTAEILRLADLANDSNIIDILSVFHRHVKKPPSDFKLDTALPITDRVAAATASVSAICKLHVTSRMKWNRDLTIGGKSLSSVWTRLWPDLWRWLETGVYLSSREAPFLDSNRQRLLGEPLVQDMNRRKTFFDTSVGLLNALLKSDHISSSLFHSTNGFIECLVEGFLYAIKTESAVLFPIAPSIADYMDADDTLKFLLVLERYQPEDGIGVIFAHAKYLTYKRDYSPYALDIITSLLRVMYLSVRSGPLRLALVRMNVLKFLTDMIGRCCSQSMLSSMDSVRYHSFANILSICLYLIHLILTADISVLFVHQILDDNLLIHLLRIQVVLERIKVFIPDVRECAGLLENVKSVFDSIGKFLAYPSIMRRVSRAQKTVQRLGIFEKYIVSQSDSGRPSTSGSHDIFRIIGDSWANMCAEVRANQEILSRIASSGRVCSNAECPRVFLDPTIIFQKCSQCLQACYCSKECQRADWKRKPEELSHKTKCHLAVEDAPGGLRSPVDELDVQGASRIIVSKMAENADMCRRITQLIHNFCPIEDPQMNADHPFFIPTVRIIYRTEQKHPLIDVLPLFDVLLPQIEDHREARDLGPFEKENAMKLYKAFGDSNSEAVLYWRCALPLGWYDAACSAREMRRVLVYVVLRNLTVARSLSVGPWNQDTGSLIN